MRSAPTKPLWWFHRHIMGRYGNVQIVNLISFRDDIRAYIHLTALENFFKISILYFYLTLIIVTN